MSKLVYILLGVLVIVYAFSKSTVMGIAVTAVVLGIAIYSIYPGYVIGRANAEFNKGNTEGALKRYRKVFKLGRANLDTHIGYAIILMRTGDCEEAMRIINMVLEHRREYRIRCEAKQTRAMINYRLGNLEEAKEEVDELFEDGFRTSATYSLQGYFMLKLNYPLDDTLRLCEEAYDYDDECRDIVDNLEVCCFKMGKFERAKELSDKLCADAPEFIEAFYHGAELYEALGDMEKAKEYALHLSECKRSVMTTITEEEEQALVKRLS